MATGGARLVVFLLFHGSWFVRILSFSRNLRRTCFVCCTFIDRVALIVRVYVLQDPDAALETGLQ